MSGLRNISALVLAAGMLCLPAFAQKPNNDRRPGNNLQSERPRRPGPHFGDWLRNNKNIPAEQQQKALESDPKFKNLPPDRQEKLKMRLQQFNALPQDQQQRILQRMETWEHMTPEQHQRARVLLDRMRALPDERRALVRQQFHSLAGLSPEQRQKVMNSDQFRRNFNEDERDMIQRSLELNDTNTESASPSLDEPPHR